MSTTILFSFRRCPYAIRARCALLAAEIKYKSIEVSLKDKPEQLLTLSPKGTVPVLVTPDIILDQSLDIINWALEKNDSLNWRRDSYKDQLTITDLIKSNDNNFKQSLDRYKYPNRYFSKKDEGARAQQSLTQCLEFLKILEERLRNSDHLIDNNTSLADIAIFPFIRQFHHVNKNILIEHNFCQLIKWLNFYLSSDMFEKVMKKPDIK